MSAIRKFNTLKKIFIIDVIVIILLAFGVICVFDNAVGNLCSSVIVDFDNIPGAMRNMALVLILVIAIYGIVSALSQNSVGRLCSEMRMKNLAWRMVAAFIVDCFCIVLITVILNLLMQDVFVYDGFNLLLFIITLYIIVANIVHSTTFGRYIFSLSIQTPCITFRDNFLRAIIKCTFSIWIPYFICFLVGIKEPLAICLDVGFFNLALYVFSLVIIKRPLWRKIYHSEIHFVSTCHFKKKSLTTFASLGIIAGCLLLVRYVNNNRNQTQAGFCGFNYPQEFPHYSNTKDIQSYCDFLAMQKESAEEYVLSLFKHYDIVVLMEPYHGEAAFWEFVGNIVCDTFFIQNVGNVFTEYGSKVHQDKVNQYLKTTYNNDTILEQQTALLMDYMSGGFYYFLKRINQQNSKLPDSLKIQEHFTDCIDWDYFSSFQVADVKDENRDSLMAEVVISWYNEEKNSVSHKLLLVTNTRHSFGYAGGIEKMKKFNHRHLTIGNQAQYIWAEFPEKTATVMCPCLNKSRMFFLPLYQEINNGKWTAALAAHGNKSVGFNLKNSPFGNDTFELYPLKGSKTPLKFSDFYTGFVFYESYSKLHFTSYPHKEYAIRTEAKIKGISDSVKINEILEYHSYDVSQDSYKNLCRPNYLPILLLIFMAALSSLLITLNFISLTHTEK